MREPLTVLLVDDCETDRLAVRRFLNQDDHSVYHMVEFATGAAALTWCQEHTADVILLDYVLPDLDGLEFLDQLHQQSGQAVLPVALLTGQGNTAVIVEAMQRGAQNYLDKSGLTVESLRQCVAYVLAQTQLKRNLVWQQEQQRLVAATALRIHQSLELDDILTTAVQEIQSLLQVERVLVYRFHPDWSGEIVVESVGAGWVPALGAVIDDPCFRHHWLEPYLQGRISWIDNCQTADLADCYRELLARFQVQANLIVPLLTGQRLWGLLIIHQCACPRQWQEREIELVQQLAIQLAIAIGQAELHAQLQRELSQRHQSEIRFQALFEQSPAGKVRFRPDGSVIAVNHAWEMIWAAPATALAGYNLLSDPAVVAEGNSPLIQRAFAGAAVVLPPLLQDPSQWGRPGRSRWVDRWLYPIKDIDGTVLEVVLVTRDITERKQAEQSLRESEEKLRLLIQYAPVGIAMLDRELRYITASQQWVEDYHLDAIESLIGRSHYEIFPELPERWRQIHQRCLAGAIARCDDDLFVRADGSQQWISWEIRPWYTAAADLGGIIIFSRDVTLRKQAELALQQLNAELEQRVAERTRELQVQQQLTQQIVDTTPAIVYLYDLVGQRNLYCNAATYDILGYTPAELQALGADLLTTLLHPDDYDRSVARTQALQQDESSVTLALEYRMRHRAGGWRWLYSYETIFQRDAAGSAWQVLGVAQDITERKQAETSLQASEAALRVLYDITSAPGLSFAQRLEQMFDFGQQQFQLDYGFFAQIVGDEYRVLQVRTPDGSVQAGTVFDLRQAYCLATVNAAEPIAIEHASQSQWCQHPGYAGFGMESYLGMRIEVAAATYGVLCFCSHQPASQPFSLMDQQILKLMCQWIGREIEQQQVTMALQESETRFRSAFEDAAVGMALVAPTGQWLRVNQSLCDIVGYAAAELLASDFQAITHPADLDLDLMYVQQLLAGERRTYQMEKRYIHKQGHLIWVLLSVSLVRDAQQQPLYFISQIEDVSDLKQADQQLQQLNTQLQKSNKELESFAFIASHDLKEPLRTVRNFSTLLQLTCGDSLSESGIDYLRRIEQATQRMQTLIDDLLQLSRVATKAAPFTTVDLNQVLAQVVANLQEQIARTGGTIHAERLPLIQADPGQMTQLWQNLVSNALKFHRDTPPIVRIYPQPDPGHPGDLSRGPTHGIQLWIEDNGIGFDPKYCDRIFGAFERLHGRHEYDGTGMGLAICKKIVERHGGTITAQSSPGQGATFIVTLPEANDQQATL